MSGAAEARERVDILLVDDRPSNLLSLKALLERPDFNLVVANSGPEALAQVLRRDFALILLDVAMPGMDGFQTASIIKEREQSKLIPIIFITASVYDMEHIFRGYTVGAVDYLRKPVDPHAVRAKVAIFVELWRQRKEIERQAARLRDIEVREQRLGRERAEAALDQSESLYQLTFDLAPVGIGHLSPAGVFTRANRRLLEILQVDGDQGEQALRGRSLASLANADDAAALGAALERLRKGDAAVYWGEHLFARGRSPGVWVELIASPFRGELIVVVTDITTRKQAEIERSRLVRDLQEGVRARDDFIALAAHELKTPLTPLRLQSSGLLREAERRKPEGTMPTELVRTRVQNLLRSIDRTEKLVDRLLDASRLNVGAIRLEFEDFDLVGLLQEIAQRFESDAAPGSPPRVDVRSTGPVTGRWDRLRIEQIATNLIANAVKYGDGQPVTVTVSSDGKDARLVVRDEGIGIALEEQERIFERFERVAPVGRYGGLGLGLWIVRLLTEAHSGRVAVKSEPGKGSEFSVELPLRPAPELGDREAKAAA